MHMVIWLAQNLRMDEIDDIVSAELPSATTHPRLHAIVTRCNLHGCSDACRRDGRCSKHFPRPFATETHFDEGR